eukprot:4375692-Pyramimonas_sp.AAC.1
MPPLATTRASRARMSDSLERPWARAAARPPCNERGEVCARVVARAHPEIHQKPSVSEAFQI